MAVYRMLLAMSDEALPKKEVKVKIKYIKKHWIGLDNKEKKKEIIITIIVTIIILVIITKTNLLILTMIITEINAHTT